MAWLFVNNNSHQAIVEGDPSFKRIRWLISSGFELVWDSAPTVEKGYEYAEEFCDAYRHECKFCGFYTGTWPATGQLYSDAHGRWLVFRNWQVCEQCVQGENIKARFNLTQGAER